MKLYKKMAKNVDIVKESKRKTLVPYEYEFTRIVCGFNLIKRKHQLSKIQRRKISLINRLKYAEQKIVCICVDVYRIYEGNDYDKIFVVISILKYKKK